MKIIDVYEKYNIPQNLQSHMLQVAAVGSIVAGWMQEREDLEIDIDIVIAELLLHDMGNILKFDFSKHVTFSEEEIDRLKKVQKEFVEKYGTDEHAATQTIAKELNVDEKVLDIMEHTGSSTLHLIVEGSDWYYKICQYADLRVAPYGIVSVRERFEDVYKRYEGRDHVLADVEKTKRKEQYAYLLQAQVQERVNESLATIDQVMVDRVVESLKGWEV